MTSSPVTSNITVKPIEPDDNAVLAQIIRATLKEFGANKPGTVYFDKSTDHLFEIFHSTPGSAYFVALQDERVVGGGGIYPTEGLPSGTCELVKMYLTKEARGLGLGRRLIETCLYRAIELNYTHVYLETMPELKNALRVYERMGFEYLTGPLGNSGHFGCELWMLKNL